MTLSGSSAVLLELRELRAGPAGSGRRGRSTAAAAAAAAASETAAPGCGDDTAGFPHTLGLSV